MLISWPCQRREDVGHNGMDGWDSYHEVKAIGWVLGFGGFPMKVEEKWNKSFKSDSEMYGALFFWRQTRMQFVHPRAIWELKFPLKLFAKLGCNEWLKLLDRLRKLVWDIAEFGNCPPKTLDKHVWQESEETSLKNLQGSIFHSTSPFRECIL